MNYKCDCGETKKTKRSDLNRSELAIRNDYFTIKEFAKIFVLYTMRKFYNGKETRANKLHDLTRPNKSEPQGVIHGMRVRAVHSEIELPGANFHELFCRIGELGK
ncbi:unnamed protein product [Sphenostylis stenocarpa]|uniref:Uncharacterized protein n=1 Tax=Sphenostylis stenocarpa TaxID=92480 RepID=A0AA86SAN8_9FABA|nr:unnamed protein product [Sphenostylis stenocarpa]